MISALCILCIGLPWRTFSSTQKPEVQGEGSKSRGLQSVLLDMREGLGYVVRSPWLWVTIVIASLGNIVIGGPIQVAFPRLVKDVYHADVWLLGVLGPAEGVGPLLGTLLVGQVARLRWRGLIAYLSLVLGSSGIVLMGLPLPPSSALLLGMGLSIFGVIWVTVLQELIPAEKQGRVFSIDALGSFALMPIGLAVMGIATDAIGPAQVFLVGGVLNIVLSWLGLCVRKVREID